MTHGEFIALWLPLTQLYDRRTYGSENLGSAMQKDFFNSIGQYRKEGATHPGPVRSLVLQ